VRAWTRPSFGRGPISAAAYDAHLHPADREPLVLAVYAVEACGAASRGGRGSRRATASSRRAGPSWRRCRGAFGGCPLVTDAALPGRFAHLDDPLLGPAGFGLQGMSPVAGDASADRYFQST